MNQHALREAQDLMRHAEREYATWRDNGFVGRELGEVRDLYLERLRRRAEQAARDYRGLVLAAQEGMLREMQNRAPARPARAA